MILSAEDAKPLLNSEGIYTGILTTKKWGYYLFKENTSPLGNIVGFRAPVQIGTMKLTNAFILNMELLHCNAFGSICFNRLYCAQLGSMLSETLDKSCYVDGNCIIVDDKQCSLSFSNNLSDASLISIIISMCTENQTILHPVQLDEPFKQKAVDSFHHLTKSIFIETQRDNI